MPTRQLIGHGLGQWTHNDVVVCRNGSGRGDESFSTSFFYGQSFDVGKSDYKSDSVFVRNVMTDLLGHRRNSQMVRGAHPPCVLLSAIG